MSTRFLVVRILARGGVVGFRVGFRWLCSLALLPVTFLLHRGVWEMVRTASRPVSLNRRSQQGRVLFRRQVRN